jgi:hypothetical protein
MGSRGQGQVINIDPCPSELDSPFISSSPARRLDPRSQDRYENVSSYSCNRAYVAVESRGQVANSSCFRPNITVANEPATY